MRNLTGAGLVATMDRPLPDRQVFPVARTCRYAGFQVELGQATLVANQETFLGTVDHLLSLDARFTNLEPGPRRFGADLAVEAGGGRYRLWWDTDLPTVASGRTGSGRLVFEVDEAFDLGCACLLVGRDGATQARVPLGRELAEVAAP